MSAALLIDFGSTYTKLRAVDLDRRRIIGAGQGLSTVATDVRIGMRAARCRGSRTGSPRAAPPAGCAW